MVEQTNYQKAKDEADKIDNIIIEVLKSRKSFRVEAGAGSGKTYSLKKVIEWLENNKWETFKKNHQQVACLTYTNTAVDVITKRLKSDSFIIPSTIHSFAWEAIKQYQNFLINYVKAHAEIQPADSDIESVKEIQYTLGSKYIKDNILYLHHNDVIVLFVRLLDEKKFRMIFSSKYPLILIDEYQDSFKSIIDKFQEYFISIEAGPQFGFFGDSWQTIYQSNKPCGLIDDKNIVEIKKISNFRSADNVVKLLNKIRPELPQITAIDDYKGEAIVVHCNDYNGQRRSDRYFNGELPIEELKNRLDHLEKIFYKTANYKTLMITHKVLSQQQGYENILEAIGDRFKENDEDVLTFFETMIEPIYNALKQNDMNLLFNVLGIKNYPITKKSEKLQWVNLFLQLDSARNSKAHNVLDIAINSHLIPIPDKIIDIYKKCQSKDIVQYFNTTIKDYLNIDYSQFIAAISFHNPNATYSTDHGVKGEEYDDVIFAIGKGWNNYQFDKYIPMISSNVNEAEKDAFIRNRNLFYVCCSRPKNRLLIFVSIEINPIFEVFLKNLVGDKNYYSYSEYIYNKKNIFCS